MSKQRLRQGKLRNLNFLIDEYEHIPQTANANEDYFVREKLRKHSSLRLFQLTRFRPNKWVEPKPPAKPVQYEQELRKDDISVQLRRKSYSSRPGYQLALSERQQKLQEEVKKLSSLKVFDQQLCSRAYSRQEKRILQSVKENAKKTLENGVQRRVCQTGRSSSPKSHQRLLEQELDCLIKGYEAAQGDLLRKTHLKFSSIRSVHSNPSKRSTLR